MKGRDSLMFDVVKLKFVLFVAEKHLLCKYVKTTGIKFYFVSAHCQGNLLYVSVNITSGSTIYVICHHV